MDDWRSIPILLNNFNRLRSTRSMVRSLSRWGCRSIYVVDNASSFPPLLRWYERQTGATVFRLEENRGSRAPWSSGVLDQIDGQFYIVSDSDLDLNLCPPDTVGHIAQLMIQDPRLKKVGLSLEIDDLPDESPFKKEVIAWESRYWQNRISNELFDAPIDTTFAMYDRERGNSSWFDNCARTDRPYTARHLPWYLTPATLTKEDRYYLEHCRTEAHWSSALQRWYAEQPRRRRVLPSKGLMEEAVTRE